MTTSSSNLDVSAAGADDGAHPWDDRLYDRMLANLLGCWTGIAEGTTGASIERVPGAVVAVFPAGPERLFYNNAVLAQDLNGSRAREQLPRSFGPTRVPGSTVTPSGRTSPSKRPTPR